MFCNSLETFQICTSLSARPESPREISSATMAKVCTSVSGSTGVPPNSCGMPNARTPMLCAPCSNSSEGRFSGTMSHSFFQLVLMKGVTSLSTKERMVSRIMRCSGVRLRSMISCMHYSAV